MYTVAQQTSCPPTKAIPNVARKVCLELIAKRGPWRAPDTPALLPTCSPKNSRVAKGDDAENTLPTKW